MDGSPVAESILARVGPLVGATFERATFRYEDLVDETGAAVAQSAYYFDLSRVQREIVRRGEFERLVALGGRCENYVAKGVVEGTARSSGTVVNGLFLARVLKWIAGDEKEQLLFLAYSPWLPEVRAFAAAEGVRVIGIRPPAQFDLRSWPRRLLGTRGIAFAKLARARLKPSQLIGLQSRDVSPSPQVVAEYHGQLNLYQPEMASSLFFVAASDLNYKDITVLFRDSRDPLDKSKWASLRKAGAWAVALTENARTTDKAPLFTAPTSAAFSAVKGPADLNRQERAWFRRKTFSYQRDFQYFEALFSTVGAGVYVDFLKHDARHFAAADAMESLGGITAFYQRSHEELPYVIRSGAIDVLFAFSKLHADVERKSGSVIPYHVTTGFLGDHRFQIIRPYAEELRGRLQRHGAKYVVSFFDENSVDDPRLGTGHESVRAGYGFVLQKLMDHPWLGLLIKPKKPSTLRQRLGPVSEMLRQAEESGRCIVLGEGDMQSSHPPAYAALASDLAVHDHLVSITAAVEAALCGVKTLVLDEEGWTSNCLYGLGVGRVVFNDWETIWDAIDEGRKGRLGEGVGNWDAILPEFDPFRDGRAAERMGSYLHWLVEGLKAGRHRDDVLQSSAERYCDAWGYDKIESVNC